MAIDTEWLTAEAKRQILQDVIVEVLIPKFLSLGMRATGEWEKSLHVVDSSIWGRKYTEQLEYGRQPGKFAPIAPLIAWAKAKFGVGEEEATSIAWAVNTKMKNEGTSWYRKGGTDLMEVLKSQEVVDTINRKAGNIIKEQIILFVSQEIKKSFK
jgi:hypothetical protein